MHAFTYILREPNGICIYGTCCNDNWCKNTHPVPVPGRRSNNYHRSQTMIQMDQPPIQPLQDKIDQRLLQEIDNIDRLIDDLDDDDIDQSDNDDENDQSVVIKETKLSYPEYSSSPTTDNDLIQLQKQSPQIIRPRRKKTIIKLDSK